MKNEIDYSLITHPPIGGVYIQQKEMKSPYEIWGGDWVELRTSIFSDIIWRRLK